jgi:coenzyme F420-reducing hydrogenase alpha subunit
MAQRITIDPITRLEGHGKIEIFLDDQGNVANTYFQIPELRGFERFVVGRPVEEMALITNRICGVSRSASHGCGEGCRRGLQSGSSAHRQDAARTALHASPAA